MNNTFKLEKWIWTEVDFEVMGWHDSRIYAVAFLDKGSGEHEFIFDIDYIFQWIQPHPPEVAFSFWVSPATLVFEWVSNLNVDLSSYMGSIQIDSIEREDAEDSHSSLWTINCQEGDFHFRASGYKQYIRKSPHLGGQELDAISRDCSFVRGKTD